MRNLSCSFKTFSSLATIWTRISMKMFSISPTWKSLELKKSIRMASWQRATMARRTERRHASHILKIFRSGQETCKPHFPKIYSGHWVAAGEQGPSMNNQQQLMIQHPALYVAPINYTYMAGQTLLRSRFQRRPSWKIIIIDGSIRGSWLSLR